ncbi:hypothetical protein [Bacillus toyonensis]|nr:hypothetical protein [Bacillus toyonensis]MCU4768210.1 hypothetical protein [Bacillus toyonensis]
MILEFLIVSFIKLVNYLFSVANGTFVAICNLLDAAVLTST